MADIMNFIALRALALVISVDGTNLLTAGCSAVRTSAGVYTITLGQECDATQCASALTMGTAARSGRLAHTSDSIKVVNIVDATPAAADGAFTLLLFASPIPLA